MPVSVEEVAKIWHGESPRKAVIQRKDNLLFRMLYDAYCRRAGVDGNYETSAQDYDTCELLCRWYQKTYKDGFAMAVGGKGVKRVASSDSGYTFDLLYSDARQFRDYLRDGQCRSGNKDLFAFTLHMAVAFLVPPDQLDKVLQWLGFHPLHVRNIHHLAIYYVLLTAQKEGLAAGVNPFQMVKQLYEAGLKIMGEAGVTLVCEDGYRFSGQETKVIRESLFLQQRLYSENFHQIVAANKEAIHMRHSKILSDFHKLIGLFLHMFYTPNTRADRPQKAISHRDLSFYGFVAQFCNENLTRKKFLEQVTGMIDKKGKHPTRNVMILLWLYAYCFRMQRQIYVTEDTCRRIRRQLEKTMPAAPGSLKAYWEEDYLDVYGFLTGTKDMGEPVAFRGSELICFINDKLQAYDWGVLNKKLPFDACILQLEKLVMDPDGRGYPVQYDGAALFRGGKAVFLQEEEEFPYPLPLIMELLEALKAENQGGCPLKCSLYEEL